MFLFTGRVHTQMYLHSWKDNEPQQQSKPLTEEEYFIDEDLLTTKLCPDTGLRVFLLFPLFTLKTTC